jgi:hypothetical protein
MGSGVVGTGATGYVNAVAALPDGELIVAGQFISAGGAVVSNVARYSPSDNSWSALRSGTNGPVTALAAPPDGDLLAGGLFTVAGATVSAYFARYSFDSSCPADFNCSGSLDSQDIFDFLNAWFARSPLADFSSDGVVAIQDIFDFLNAWFVGC